MKITISGASGPIGRGPVGDGHLVYVPSGHGRSWPERSVYGTVRSTSRAGTEQSGASGLRRPVGDGHPVDVPSGHGRPWPERSIYGTVRSMSRAGMERKTNVQAYLREIEGIH